MAKNMLASLNMESARLGSAEPMLLEDPELKEIIAIIKGDKKRFVFLSKVFSAKQVEIKTMLLPRFIRDLVGVLRNKPSNSTAAIVRIIIDEATWAIEKGDSLCFWEDGAGDQENSKDILNQFYPKKSKTNHIK